MNLNETLQQAVALHQAGQFAEAEDLYRSILQAEPTHPDANHNLGLMALQLGKADIGFPFLEAAWKAAPTVGQYWFSLTECLLAMGHASEALLLIKEAIRSGIKSPQAQQLLMRAKGGNSKAQPSSALVQEVLSLFNAAYYAELEGRIKPLVELYPNWALGWTLLGVALHKQGKVGESALRRAVELTPNDAEAHNNLGGVLKDQGDMDAAAASFRKALKINPKLADAHCNLAMVLQAKGQLNEALAGFRQALKIKPNYVDAHFNLGVLFNTLNRLDDAEASYRRALQLKPDYAEVHSNLGNTLQDLGRLDEAEASYRRALEFKPDNAAVLCNLGNVLSALGRLDEAEEICRRALEIRPDFVKAHNNLGNVLKHMSRLGEAEASYRRAIEIRPDYAEAYNNMSDVLRDSGRLDEAEASCRRALEIKPDFAGAYNNMGGFLHLRGKTDDAMENFRRALEIEPDFAQAHTNLIFSLDLANLLDKSELLGERKKWDEVHAAPLWRDPIHSNDRSPARRLRIGYVSGDLMDHSAAKAFGGMLTQYDRTQFEVFAYSNIGFTWVGDKMTNLFKQSVTAWRDIASLSDDVVVKMIHEDQIDILVDLSGHTAGGRLLVFARKPAPIQITAWGYATGTGMRAMDVIFTDPVVVPPQEKHYFTEEVRYLPSFLGSFFPDPFPDVNELPALSDDIITFGSFNRLVKVSDDAYRAWILVLLAIPQSRLIMKTGELNDASTREQIVQNFTKAGVAADRIIMQGKTSWYEHVRAYQQIDFVLDPFPQGGGVTALEGLMMGVPMITLRGQTVAGRASASIMTTLGLTDWIAETQEQYVELALQKAADLQSLAVLRRQLRGIFTSSVLGDQVAYARAVEQEYRLLWQRWCAS